LKIAVVGCGALGSFYGASLCRAGHEVHFLLRSDFEAVQRAGVFIRSPKGDFHARPLCARTPEAIGRSDLVLIGLKTTANSEFPRLIPLLVGPATAIATLQNGLGNEEALARLFPGEQILGGLCFVCLNRLAPGLVHHMAHGRVVLGEFAGRATARTGQIAAHFRAAGVRCDVTEDLARSHWEKLAWNIPFNGLGVAGAAGYDVVLSGQCRQLEILQPCLTTEQLLDGGRWEKLVRELMAEVIAAAQALGFGVASTVAEGHISRTRQMGPYKASTLIDFERGQPLELEALFFEPFRQARRASVAVPRLSALCAVLEALEKRAAAARAGSHREQAV
jgi:2-dehydropantoate 2-reductase